MISKVLKTTANKKEAIIESIDGDPLSAIGFSILGKNKKIGCILRAIAFATLTHATQASVGMIDIPWGSSSAFGIPHYRRLRESQEERMVEEGKFLISYYNRYKGE